MPAVHLSDIAPSDVPFSAGYRAGDFLFVSGQIATRADGRVLLGDFSDEVGQTLDKVQAILRAGGATFADVVKVGVWLSNSMLFPEFNAIYRRRFTAAPPARSTLVVDFGHPGVRVEVDAIAYLPS